MKTWRKVIATISTFALLLNSLVVPLRALAQTATPEPTPAPTESATASPEATDSTSLTASPTVQPTTTPDATPAETATSTPEATPVATDLITPTPSDQPIVTQAPESNPTTQGPPADSNQSVTEPSISPSVTPTATPTQPEKEGTITTTVIENIDLSTIIQLNSNVDVPTVTTDKPDYSPTSVVLITGTGFVGEKNYSLEIISQDEPPVTNIDSVKTNSEGTFSYAYQLDGNYRPNYKIDVKDGEFVVASTTFTDSPASIWTTDSCSGGAQDVNHYSIGDDVYVNGKNFTGHTSYSWSITGQPGSGDPSIQIANGSQTTNHDGEICFKAYTVLTGDSGEYKVDFGGKNDNYQIDEPTGLISGQKFSDLNDDHDRDNGEPWLSGWTFNLTLSGAPVQSVTTDANGNYSFANLPDGNYKVCEVPQANWSQTYPRSSTSNSTDCPSSTRGFLVTIDNGGSVTGKNFGNHQQQTTGTLTIHKVDQGGSPLSGVWVQVSGPSNPASKQTDASGNATFSNINTGGPYTINVTEPTNYHFTSVDSPCTGTNPTNLSLATLTTSGATCTVRDTIDNGTLTVKKHVVGGTATAPDWTMHIKNGADQEVASFAGSEGGSNSGLVPGSYTVTETGNPTGYTLSYSGDCDADGHVTITANTPKTCTLTNTLITGTITVHKDFDGDPPATYSNSCFTLSPNPTGFGQICSNSDGNAVFSNVPAGTYSVDETKTDTDYSQKTNNCSGLVIASSGESKNCTVTNKHDTGRLVIQKAVDDGSDLSQWSFSLDGNTAIHASISGIVDFGQVITNDAHYLTEFGPNGYHFVSFTGTNCNTNSDGKPFATVVKGGTTTCTFTNARDTGSLTVHKIIDADGDINTLDDQSDGGNWEFTTAGNGGDTNGSISQSTGSNGIATFNLLKTGSYNITETLQDGYDFVSANCGSITNDGNTVYGVNVTTDGATCTFYNTPNGSIHGVKWDDANNNGQNDGENLLGNWSINLYKLNSDDNYDFVESTVTDNNVGPDFGWYVFNHLFPGQYKVCEDLKNGWMQTYPGGDGCHIVSVPQQFTESEGTQNSVFAPTNNFGNLEEKPGISISKTNNKGGGMNAGNTVDYSITLTNNGNIAVSNISIQDILPGGFTYVPGSTTGEISTNPSISGSVLTWSEFGPLASGASITIYYQAKSSSDLADGLYVNFADCSAMTKSEKVVSCDPSANSTVKIGSGTNFGGGLGGQVLGISKVLGASTELPGTGSPTGLLVLALGLLTVGFILKKHAKN